MRYRNPTTMVPRQPNETPVVPSEVTKARGSTQPAFDLDSCVHFLRKAPNE